MCGTAMVSAQTIAASPDTTPSMEVRRIGLADLNGVLRAADANVKVRELLDVQRQKFQSEFSKVEAELQQTERDLMSKRELLSVEEYDKQIKAFQARVTRLQQDIQRKRQSIDNAYQKAQSDIRAEAVSVITEIASELRLDLVLKRDSSLIFLPHLNISDEVLKRLNERTKNARIEIEVQEPQSQ
jgi:outer membrane protein